MQTLRYAGTYLSIIVVYHFDVSIWETFPVLYMTYFVLQILVRQRGLHFCMDVLKKLNEVSKADHTYVIIRLLLKQLMPCLCLWLCVKHWQFSPASFQVNEQNGQIIRYEHFYIPQLRDKVDIRADYISWISQRSASSMLSFCNYPFVFDAQAKTMLLQTDALLQMQVGGCFGLFVVESQCFLAYQLCPPHPWGEEGHLDLLWFPVTQMCDGVCLLVHVCLRPSVSVRLSSSIRVCAILLCNSTTIVASTSAGKTLLGYLLVLLNLDCLKFRYFLKLPIGNHIC